MTPICWFVDGEPPLLGATSPSTSGGPPGKPKKRVTWAPEAHLRDIRLFVVDESERVNVNKLGAISWDEMKKRERMMDRQGNERSIARKKRWDIAPSAKIRVCDFSV